jgi:hypothetical protein
MAHAQSASIGFMSTPVYFPVEMRKIPNRTNISPGSQVSAVAAQLTLSSATSAFFQIQATGAGGYVLNRLDAYSNDPGNRDYREWSTRSLRCTNSYH